MSCTNIEHYHKTIWPKMEGRVLVLVDDTELIRPLRMKTRSEVFMKDVGGKRIIEIRKILRDYGISTIVITGFRVADLRVLIAANQQGVKIVYKMHGMYVKYMPRSPGFIITKFRKTLRTILYLCDISIVMRNPLLLFKIPGSFFFGLARSTWFSPQEFQPTYASVWSAYWIKWHKDNWNISPAQSWVETGNPDLENFDIIERDGISICYVYQTLVEDGRVDRRTMQAFYKDLVELCRRKEIGLVIKWHPRGLAQTRRWFESEGLEVVDEVPKTSLALGHYSTLLGMFPVLNIPVVVFELEKHPTPESIESLAACKVRSMDALEDELPRALLSEPAHEEAVYYFGGPSDDDALFRVLQST